MEDRSLKEGKIRNYGLGHLPPERVEEHLNRKQCCVCTRFCL